MRPVFGTANTSTSVTAVQLYNTDTNGRMYAISVKARVGNSSNAMYFGFSSTVSSASGWELTPGDFKGITFSEINSNQSANQNATVKATSAWVNAASTTDQLDWQILLEN